MNKKEIFAYVRRMAREESKEVSHRREGYFPGHQILTQAQVIVRLESLGFQVGGPNGDVSLEEIRVAVSSLAPKVDPLNIPGRYASQNIARIFAPAA